MNASCPDCSLEYAMQQEALDRLGCMYCPWDGTDTEKRPGHPRQETDQAAAMNYQEEAVAMSHSTAPDLSEYWHPTWCARDSFGFCGPEVDSEAMHASYAETWRVEEKPYHGTELEILVRRYMLETPDPDTYPDDIGLTLHIAPGSSFEDLGHAVLNTERMRDLADFLFTEADRLDHWREVQDARRKAAV